MAYKVQMKASLVEIDGDEMTRVMWAMVKEKLLLPQVDLITERYDLALEKRDETDNIPLMSSIVSETQQYGGGFSLKP